MDQPTNIKITIKGKKEDVKLAALSAERRIDLETRGFKESEYVMGSELEKLIEKTIYFEGDKAVCDIEEESYACIYDSDITDIAEEIIKVAPEVEFQIAATITITFSEGYDLCVDISYVNGEMNEEIFEEYYEGWEDEDEWEEDEEKN